jgi:hypothetical protein
MAAGTGSAAYSLAASISSYLTLLLQHGLQQRQVQARLGVERHRLCGNVLSSAAQHEGVEQIVGNQLARLVEVLGLPRRGDSIPHLARESGTLERHVAENGHHVDHEWLALGSVQRLAAGLVHERQKVRRRLDGGGVAAGGRGRGAQPLQDSAQRRDRLAGTGQIAVGLLSGQL